MVQTFNTLSDAIALAEFAHRNQVDKAGLPYIEHPRRVLAKVQAQGALPYVQMAAILHDVTEDTSFSTLILRALGVPESATHLVSLLDRHYSKRVWELKPRTQTPDEFYYEGIANNPHARLVKLADIEDNLSPWRLTYLEPETQDRLRAKYAKAHELLRA